MPRSLMSIGSLSIILSLLMSSAVQGVVLLPVGIFEIVPGDSSVTFSVPDNRGGFTGRTTKITGRIVVEPRRDGEEYVARVDAMIDTSSITTGDGTRDAGMRSTYLSTGQFPSMTFKGTVSAQPGLAVRPFAATVHGQLTIRDVTRDVEFPTMVTALAREFLADAETTVRMADYGIPYPRAFIFVARDPVTVTLHIRARQP
ncbi:MAG TPA: YceI family protein [bacterium]|nr:YceI family protein [bacterium]